MKHDNLADGNCFFSAIYYACKTEGILEHLGQCIGVRTQVESDFINDSRKFVTQLIDIGKATPRYNHLKELFDTDIENLNMIKEIFPQYLKTMINKKIIEKRRNTSAQFFYD